MQNKSIAWAAIAGLTVAGCSSRPREFNPVLASPSANQAEFDAAYATCQQLFVQGKLNSTGRAGSAGAGVAAGATTAAVGSTVATAAAGYAGMAVAAATVVLLPFAVLGGAWGMSRMKRAKKERAIKIAMEGCLDERGYRVAGWSTAEKKPIAATRQACSVRRPIQPLRAFREDLAAVVGDADRMFELGAEASGRG